MGCKPATPEDLFENFRAVEIESGKVISDLNAYRKLEICDQTYFPWKRENPISKMHMKDHSELYIMMVLAICST